jgi:PTH1 family peptidyl-tRNA hydrolase
MFQLIVGVGNPGSEYANTRHNIAWMLMDSCPAFQNANWKAKFKGYYAEGSHKGQKFYGLKPQTFMNLSGESVQPMAAFFKIPPSEILVLHDEVDIPYGQVHFKVGGGLAGHNGLKSIAAHLGTNDFGRMRIGIGKPVHGSMSAHVLGQFSKDEQIQMSLLFQKLNDPLLSCMVDGITKIATVYNKKDLLA